MSNKSFIIPDESELNEIYNHMYDLPMLFEDMFDGDKDSIEYKLAVMARMIKIGYDYMKNNPGQQFTPPDDISHSFDD